MKRLGYIVTTTFDRVAYMLPTKKEALQIRKAMVASVVKSCGYTLPRDRKDVRDLNRRVMVRELRGRA